MYFRGWGCCWCRRRVIVETESRQVYIRRTSSSTANKYAECRWQPPVHTDTTLQLNSLRLVFQMATAAFARFASVRAAALLVARTHMGYDGDVRFGRI